jgi:hypothetical protein
MSIAGHLQEREETSRQSARQSARDFIAREWLNQAAAPEVRLAKFDRWLIAELDHRLDWAWAGAAKVQRQQQCRIQIDGMVLALWRRGWMLDGKRLAARITEMLDAIGKAQRAEQVRDFWPYFKTSVSRYVGLNSEEIREEAMSAGVAASDVFRQLTKGLPDRGPSIPELVAQRANETIRAKLTKQRAQEARKQADAAQMPLL